MFVSYAEAPNTTLRMCFEHLGGIQWDSSSDFRSKPLEGLTETNTYVTSLGGGGGGAAAAAAVDAADSWLYTVRPLNAAAEAAEAEFFAAKKVAEPPKVRAAEPGTGTGTGKGTGTGPGLGVGMGAGTGATGPLPPTTPPPEVGLAAASVEDAEVAEKEDEQLRDVEMEEGETVRNRSGDGDGDGSEGDDERLPRAPAPTPASTLAAAQTPSSTVAETPSATPAAPAAPASIPMSAKCSGFLRRMSVEAKSYAGPTVAEVAEAAEVWPGICFCHVIGCRLTQETRVNHALDDAASNGPGTYCSPRHRMPLRCCLGVNN